MPARRPDAGLTRALAPSRPTIRQRASAARTEGQRATASSMCPTAAQGGDHPEVQGRLFEPGLGVRRGDEEVAGGGHLAGGLGPDGLVVRQAAGGAQAHGKGEQGRGGDPEGVGLA